MNTPVMNGPVAPANPQEAMWRFIEAALNKGGFNIKITDKNFPMIAQRIISMGYLPILMEQMGVQADVSGVLGDRIRASLGTGPEARDQSMGKFIPVGVEAGTAAARGAEAAGFGTGYQAGLYSDAVGKAEEQGMADYRYKQSPEYAANMFKAAAPAFDSTMTALGSAQSPQAAPSQGNPFVTALAGGLGTAIGGSGWLSHVLCHTARAVLGDAGPWTTFRQWVFRHAPRWLARVYVVNTEKWGQLVRQFPALKIVLRPPMLLAVAYTNWRARWSK